MKKRICPVCDQEMRSSMYCKTCRRFVRDPYIREINYYLNEVHPQDETDCSYHNVPTTQSQVSPQPHAGWQRQNIPQGTKPSYHTTQTTRLRRTTTAAGQTGKKKESNKWILLLAAFFVVVFVGASQFFRFAANQFKQLEALPDYEVDLGPYGEEWFVGEPSEEESYEEELLEDEFTGDVTIYLTDDEARALSERCTCNFHFSITMDEVESEVVNTVKSYGYPMENKESDSENVQYINGSGTEESSYATRVYYEVVEEQSEPEEDEYTGDYAGLYFNYDTATDELHSMEISLFDMEQVIKIAGDMLDLMETKGIISPGENSRQILDQVNQESFFYEEFFLTADERVEIYCYEYIDSYCIVFYPVDDYVEQVE